MIDFIKLNIFLHLSPFLNSFNYRLTIFCLKTVQIGYMPIFYMSFNLVLFLDHLALKAMRVFAITLHQLSVVRPSTIHIWSSPLKLLVLTKLWWNGPLSELSRHPDWPSNMTAVIKEGTKRVGVLKNFLVWNWWANWNQTLVEWSSNGLLPTL